MANTGADTSVYRNLELESKVANATPHQLVQILFDELLICLGRAKEASLHGQTSEKNAVLEKASNIILYLRQTLSEEGESDLPHNLGMLYEYMLRQLLSARLRDDMSLIDEVHTLIETIASGWRDIAESSTP